MIKALTPIVLAVLLSSCHSIPVERTEIISPLPTKGQAHRLFSHTVRLKAGLKSSPGAELSGSGTIINESAVEHGWEYTLLTAAHVLHISTGTSGLYVEIDVRDNDGWITNTIRKDITSSYVERYSLLYDTSIVKFLVPDRLPVVPAAVASESKVNRASPGSWIIGIGCSFGHPAVVGAGIISGRVRDLRAPVSSWMVASVNWDGGSSGGGVYNSDFKLIGIISAEQGSNVGLYVPLTSDFLDSDGTTSIYELIELFEVVHISAKRPTLIPVRL